MACHTDHEAADAWPHHIQLLMITAMHSPVGQGFIKAGTTGACLMKPSYLMLECGHAGWDLLSSIRVLVAAWKLLLVLCCIGPDALQKLINLQSQHNLSL